MWHTIVGCWIVSCYVAHQWASWNVLLIARPSCSVLQLSAHQVHSPLVDHIALVILAACIPNRYFARWDSRIMDPQYLHHPRKSVYYEALNRTSLHHVSNALPNCIYPVCGG